MNVLQKERNGNGAHSRQGTRRSQLTLQDQGCQLCSHVLPRTLHRYCVFWNLFHPFSSPIRLTPPSIEGFRVFASFVRSRIVFEAGSKPTAAAHWIHSITWKQVRYSIWPLHCQSLNRLPEHWIWCWQTALDDDSIACCRFVLAAQHAHGRQFESLYIFRHSIYAMFPTTLMEGKRHTVLELRARRERLFTDGMELPIKLCGARLPPCL